MARIRCLSIIVILIAIIWSCPSYGQTIRFAQVTDVHIFDSADKPTDSQPENERGLRWAIDEINRRNAIGPAYEFVVYTGDLGLEKTLKRVLENSKAEELDSTLDEMAARFGEFLNKSDVRLWILVPGNNDLIDENPSTINYFHTFVEKLQNKVGSRKTIKDFAPVANSRAWIEKGNCWFLGFDNASFKSNNKLTDRNTFHELQNNCLSHLKDNLEAAKGQIAKYNADPQNQNKKRKFYAYIFCHIPDIDDPYLSSLKETDEQLCKKKTPPDDVDFREFPRSAWIVKRDTRNTWEGIIEEDYVKRVFAGHFHSDDRRAYHNLNLTRKDIYKYKQSSFDKMLICPPIAVKNQVGAGEDARGFRDVTVDGETGNVSSEIVWLNRGSAGTYPNDHVENNPAWPQPDTRRRYDNLIFRVMLLIVVLLLGLVIVFAVATKTSTSGIGNELSRLQMIISAIGWILIVTSIMGLIGLLLLA